MDRRNEAPAAGVVGGGLIGRADNASAADDSGLTEV